MGKMNDDRPGDPGTFVEMDTDTGTASIFARRPTTRLDRTIETEAACGYPLSNANSDRQRVCSWPASLERNDI